MKFIIQTINNDIKFDFQLELIHAIEFLNYFNQDNIGYVKDNGQFKISNPTAYCPIGSVEYVIEYIKKHFGEKVIPKPKNVPEELINNEFTNRRIINIDINQYFDKNSLDESTNYFIKSNDIIKYDGNGIYNINNLSLTDGNYQVSEYFENGFKAEFRCFVFDKTLIDVRLYTGDFKLLPDFNKINSMINAYKSAPCAYTLDVGITEKNETVIIEVHDFFSCGLYGFMPIRRLPYMFWRWYKEFIIKNNIQ